MEEDPEVLRQRNNELIDTWAPHERDNWSTAAETEEPYVRMHRTALIALARVREAQAAADAGRQRNIQLRRETTHERINHHDARRAEINAREYLSITPITLLDDTRHVSVIAAESFTRAMANFIGVSLEPIDTSKSAEPIRRLPFDL